MTQYIYFDLGNVLLTFDHGRARKQIALLADVDQSTVQDLIFDDGLLLPFETGQIDARQFHSTFCDATNTDTDLAEFLNAYSDIFEIIAPMEQLIARLHDHQFPLGILSNTSSAHWNHVCDGRFPFLPGRFRDFVLSFEEASMKPDRTIYEAAIARTGCSPPDIFFCDDRSENVSGARSIGIDAVRFESPDQIKAELESRLMLKL